jgi:hypothetical protein
MCTDTWPELRPDAKASEESKDTSQKFLNTFKTPAGPLRDSLPAIQKNVAFLLYGTKR